MSNRLNPPAVDPATLSVRTGSSYPKPFRGPVQARRKRELGEALGLSHYGVNLVELEPGAWSSQRHWHSHEDEFVYVLSGEVTLVSDGGRQRLGPGSAAGFPAGAADGHHLVNDGDQTAVYLEVGDRSDLDEVHYPDIDLVLTAPTRGRAFLHRDGQPYEQD